MVPKNLTISYFCLDTQADKETYDVTTQTTGVVVVNQKPPTTAKPASLRAGGKFPPGPPNSKNLASKPVVASKGKLL